MKVVIEYDKEVIVKLLLNKSDYPLVKKCFNLFISSKQVDVCYILDCRNIPMDIHCRILRIYLIHILACNGIFAFHSSGFMYQNTPYIFMGEASSGKTSLLLSGYRNNCKLLGDEVILIKEVNSQFVLLPFSSCIYLENDVMPIPPENFTRKAPLKFIIFIERGKKEVFHKLPSFKSRLFLSKYILWAVNEGIKKQQFNFINKLSKIPSYRWVIKEDSLKDFTSLFQRIKNVHHFH